ncbi:hypothetical protein AD998_21455 [bacterium 336/3]|nr:hypothetical protein AD998_21455 [bacterium 336/3]
MKYILIIITLICTSSCFGQYHFDKTKISKKIEEIIKRIKDVNQVMGNAVYYEGIKPPQYDNFIELRNKATQKELLELTNHPNGVVRCYAFWALSYIQSVDLLPVIIKHIDDDEFVSTQFGCIRDEEKVGDFFINCINSDVRKLSVSESKYLDSILIYTPNQLYAKEDAIDRAELTESFYKRVRELVIKEKNQSALVAIAKYKREQDVSLILNNKNDYYTYQAMALFPHPDFLPFLQNKLIETLGDDHFDSAWRGMYATIASYKNDKALELLQIPFTQVKHKHIQKYHMEFIFGALEKFYSPIYEPLLWRMWEDENLVDLQNFKILYYKNAEKAFELAKKTIENADDFYYTKVRLDKTDEKSPDLLEIMLDSILARNRFVAIELINKNIRGINVHHFPIFANKALQLKEKVFITSLLDRLEKETNPYIYLKATETLIAFQDKSINKQILEIYKRNKSLQTGWGGENFAELLKKHKIE